MANGQNDAHLPPDRGRSGLGLIMDLGGTMYAALIGAFGLMQLIQQMQMRDRYGGEGGPSSGWLALVLLACFVRSMVHRSAGRELTYGLSPRAALKRYYIVAAVQTGVLLVYFQSELNAPTGMWMPIVLLLAAWPAALAIITSRPGMLPEDGAERVVCPDRNYDGLGILMTIFGVIGTLFGAILLWSMSNLGGRGKPPMFTLLLLVMVGLVVRSVLHVMAGSKIRSGADMDAIDPAINRYVSTGVGTAMAFGGAFLIMIMQAGGGGAGAMMMAIFVFIGGIVWMLLAWPLTVRTFHSDRRMDLYAVGGPSLSNTRSVDHGRTTLGWLLLAFGATALVSSVSGFLFSSGGEGMSEGGMGGLGGLSGIMMMGQTGHRVELLGLAVAAAQVWAAVELLWMTPRHKNATLAYGALAAAVSFYNAMPILEHLDQLGGLDMSGGGPMVFGAMAMAMVLPIGSILIVLRDLPTPAQPVEKVFE